jgi:hypothetical protein
MFKKAIRWATRKLPETKKTNKKPVLDGFKKGGEAR